MCFEICVFSKITGNIFCRKSHKSHKVEKVFDFQMFIYVTFLF
uniref:Uncharacterized protein n=1 Tax=Siphoviridae sp. ctPAi1 TaxID=2826320 RepID=A0A8S5M805_9CAUD|nr:MAG TPA: hypothetical protein [Siphoviridae sp. ctPAi1]